MQTQTEFVAVRRSWPAAGGFATPCSPRSGSLDGLDGSGQIVVLRERSAALQIPVASAVHRDPVLGERTPSPEAWYRFAG